MSHVLICPAGLVLPAPQDRVGHTRGCGTYHMEFSLWHVIQKVMSPRLPALLVSFTVYSFNSGIVNCGFVNCESPMITKWPQQSAKWIHYVDFFCWHKNCQVTGYNLISMVKCQLQFIANIEDAINAPVNLQTAIKKYQDVLQYARSEVNFAFGVGLYILFLSVGFELGFPSTPLHTNWGSEKKTV